MARANRRWDHASERSAGPSTRAARASGGRTPDAALALDAVEGLREPLLAWFRVHQRDLPWRRSRDPYRVWISEAMLQQTRVDVVVAYFERFVARFPTLASLAAAPLDDVLAAWSGLGYYRRARALHAAATAIVARHAGLFPASREELLELPGIGPYTAGAVASIAFDAPEALVDGNVARVLARLFEIEATIGTPELERTSWALARALVPARGAGEWNQALMELGATVCAPRTPSCGLCPVRARCRSFAMGRTDELPRPKPRRAAVEVELSVALVREGNAWLVEQRPAAGRMASLWQLPTIEPGAAGLLHAAEWPRNDRAEPLIAVDEPLGEVRHTITHHRIRARFFAARWLAGEPAAPLAWAAEADLERFALTGMTRKILRAARSAR